MSFPRYPAYKDSGVEWLGWIPLNWTAKRLRFVCQINPLRSETQALPSDTFVSFVPMEAIGEDGSLQATELRALGDVGGGYTYFRNDDVLVAKITPCFENGKGALCRNLYNGIGLGTTELHVLRARFEIRPDFLFYLTRSPGFHDQGEASMYGAGGQKRVPADFVADFPAPLPPLPEQRAIAAFLDTETARIDTLMAKQQALIATLQEKRRALISHAVTKGLDPAAPMKDSGVPWLGAVPAHWEVKRLKFIANVRTGVAKGRNLGNQETIEVPYLRVANVQDGYLDLSDVSTIPFARGEVDRYLLRHSDLLMNEGGDFDKLGRGYVWQGEIEPCSHQNHVFAVRLHDPEDAFWVNLATQTFYAKQYFISRSKQSTNLASISLSNIQEWPVVIPPQEERKLIRLHVEAGTSSIDILIAKAQTFIELLREHRTALIAAAVTGQIDVRGYTMGETT